MSSAGPGWPDDQQRGLPFDEVLASGSGINLPAPPGVYSTSQLVTAHYQQLAVNVVSGAGVTATVTWTMSDAGLLSAGTTTLSFNGTGAVPQLVPTQGHLAVVDFLAAGAGQQLAFYVVGSNVAPFSGAAQYARLTARPIAGDPAITVVSGVQRKVPWYHFTTSDQTVFSTTLAGGGGGNTAGDDSLRVAKKGVVLIYAAILFVGGAFARYAQPFGGDIDLMTTGSSQANDTNANTAPTGSSLWLVTAAAWRVSSAPQLFGAHVFQSSGVNKTLDDCTLGAVYLPAGAADVTVFG